MDLSLQKKFTSKRWLILIASCLINLCIGSLYAWSVFVAPMAAHITEVQSPINIRNAALRGILSKPNPSAPSNAGT